MPSFEKWQACGNDFIIISEDRVDELEVCNRHYGIGADGVLYVTKSDKADAKMTVINADGSEAEMCGNGIRCVAQYLSDKIGKTDLNIETKAGIKHIEIIEAYEKIKVDMGQAKLIWDHEIELPKRVYDASFIDIGNPHCILFVNEVKEGEVERFGRQIERMRTLFPEGTNVEFVTVENDNLRVRVWERGCGRTLACGTGACSSAFAAHKRGLISDNVDVKLDGGTVNIKLSETVHMTGPAKRVFKGKIN